MADARAALLVDLRDKGAVARAVVAVVERVVSMSMPCMVDLRDDDAVARAVVEVVERVVSMSMPCMSIELLISPSSPCASLALKAGYAIMMENLFVEKKKKNFNKKK